MNNEVYKYWSMHTGEIYNVLDDEVQALDAFQVRLKNLPKSNCNVCYGTFKAGKNNSTGLYLPCPKCGKKCIDFDAITLNDEDSNIINS